jgi:hypothetical protein
LIGAPDPSLTGSAGFWVHDTPASSTVTGLARRVDQQSWQAVLAATATVTRRVIDLAPATVRARLSGPPTIDLDATDIEVSAERNGT